MKNLIQSIQLTPLYEKTQGSPEITIGVIDGPAAITHPDLQQTKIESSNIQINSSCSFPESHACNHGTMVLGILAARRGSPTPALCPGCSFIMRPIFCEAGPGISCPQVTSADLVTAINDTVDAGAKIINLSLGLASGTMQPHPALDSAFDNARKRGVLIVGAAGNQGRIGHMPLFKNDWVIPAVAANAGGNPIGMSNLGISVGRRGLMAPGENIPTLSSTGGYTTFTGTSAAAPFITGTAALLWSLYPNLSAFQIRKALLTAGGVRKTILPPALNADAVQRLLINI